MVPGLWVKTNCFSGHWFQLGHPQYIAPYVDNNTQISLWVINTTTSPPSPSSLHEAKN